MKESVLIFILVSGDVITIQDDAKYNISLQQEQLNYNAENSSVQPRLPNPVLPNNDVKSKHMELIRLDKIIFILYKTLEIKLIFRWKDEFDKASCFQVYPWRNIGPPGPLGANAPSNA